MHCIFNDHWIFFQSSTLLLVVVGQFCCFAVDKNGTCYIILFVNLKPCKIAFRCLKAALAWAAFCTSLHCLGPRQVSLPLHSHYVKCVEGTNAQRNQYVDKRSCPQKMFDVETKISCQCWEISETMAKSQMRKVSYLEKNELRCDELSQTSLFTFDYNRMGVFKTNLLIPWLCDLHLVFQQQLSPSKWQLLHSKKLTKP